MVIKRNRWSCTLRTLRKSRRQYMNEVWETCLQLGRRHQESVDVAELFQVGAETWPQFSEKLNSLFKRRGRTLGPGTILNTGDAVLSLGFLWSQPPLSPVLGSLTLQPFPLPRSRPRPAALSASAQSPREPLVRGPSGAAGTRARSSNSCPLPLGLPQPLRPSSQATPRRTGRLPYLPSPRRHPSGWRWDRRPAHSERPYPGGPGPGPSPGWRRSREKTRLQPRDPAPAPLGRLSLVGRGAQARRHPRAGPAPARDRSLRRGRAAVSGARAQAH